VHDGEPFAQRDVGARVRAEVAQAQAGDEHQAPAVLTRSAGSA
jgi:hypothetical protein